MQKGFIYLFCFALNLFSCSTIDIIDKPIDFNEERIQLSIDYLEKRYGIENKQPTIIPRMIVVHWTAIPSFEKSFNAFKPVKLPNTRPEITDASTLNVSAHFLVDQGGRIYRLMPETTMARHVIGLNHCAIGIENVGGTTNRPLTKKQLKSNIKLVKYLKEKYGGIDYLIGHFEYTLFEDHALWLEKDDNYRTEKTDPGKEFIKNLRKSTTSLNWEPLPSNF